MYKIDAEVILYDNVEELEFCTNHPYWISINGYVIKISKKVCQELKYMHKMDKPELSELEKTILNNLDKDYKYIARDRNNQLFIYKNYPEKDSITWRGVYYELPFPKLFKFITWDTLYVIKDLLEANNE